jgi:tetratricopeptide (TPR) repeat protein
VIQLDPTSVPAYVICGLCTQYEDWKESIGHFKTALAIDPADFGAPYNLGVVMLSRHQRNAWEPLQEALKLEKEINLDDYLVRDTLQWLAYLTNTPTNKSLQLPLKLAIAKAYRDGQQYERAIQEYKEVLKIEPDNPAAPSGLFYTYNDWRGSDDSDALHWKRRVNGKYIMAGLSTETYLPEVLFNYFGMLR